MAFYDKLTVKAQEALAASQDLALRHNHTESTPVHILSALLSQSDGIALPILKKLEVNAGALSEEIERIFATMPTLDHGVPEVRPSIAMQELLRRSVNEAEQPEAVTSFFYDEMDFTYTPLMDEEAAVGTAYGAVGLPATFFVDPSGVVQAVSPKP